MNIKTFIYLLQNLLFLCIMKVLMIVMSVMCPNRLRFMDILCVKLSVPKLCLMLNIAKFYEHIVELKYWLHLMK